MPQQFPLGHSICLQKLAKNSSMHSLYSFLSVSMSFQYVTNESNYQIITDRYKKQDAEVYSNNNSQITCETHVGIETKQCNVTSSVAIRINCCNNSSSSLTTTQISQEKSTLQFYY